MESESKTLVIPPPDDMHVHLRDGKAMACVLKHTVKRHARVLVMPNLVPPVVTTKDALDYRERILAALEDIKQEEAQTGEQSLSSVFYPLMSLYLTNSTSPEEIKRAKASGHIYAVKFYPAGATTNSANGVTDIKACLPTLEAIAAEGLLLLVHGEVTNDEVDVFEREQVFLSTQMRWLVDAVPSLKIVLEHATTREAVEFVNACGPNVAATLTAHHLLYNRTNIFRPALDPHLFCLPVIKREEDRVALLAAATSGSPKFFLGTDSAPHSKHNKECCGHAGCYTAFASIELYAEAFAKAGKLQFLHNFASVFGASFYGLSPTAAFPYRIELEVYLDGFDMCMYHIHRAFWYIHTVRTFNSPSFLCSCNNVRVCNLCVCRH
jgi:dihydroorotase